MENKDLSLELQSKDSPEPTSRDLGENLKNYEPDTEAIRQSFSDLGNIKISKALPLLISLAPVLTTLVEFYLQTKSINYCYTVPEVFWNTTDNGTYPPLSYQKINVSACIICNGENTMFLHPSDRTNNMTKGVVGLFLYLFGFYLIYRMFQDASVAIKLLAYKVRVKCNNYSVHVFIFFGAILCFGIYGTSGLVDPFPKSLPSCPNISAYRLFVSDNDFPASQLWFMRQFVGFFVLMAGFFSLFMSLMQDSPSLFVKVRNLISLATTFNYNKTQFLDFKDIKYEINSKFIHHAIAELGLQKEMNEKHKFMAVLSYLDENKKIFECKPEATSFKLESLALNLFGITEDVHHGLNLDQYVGKQGITDQEILALRDLYSRLNDDLSSKLWPSIFVMLLGFDTMSAVITLSKHLVTVSLGIEEFQLDQVLSMVAAWVQIIIGATAFRRRMVVYFKCMFVLFSINAVVYVFVLGMSFLLVYTDRRNTGIMVTFSMTVVSFLFAITWGKLSKTFRDIRKLKQILADQGIHVDVLQRRKRKEEERAKYLQQTPSSSINISSEL